MDIYQLITRLLSDTLRTTSDADPFNELTIEGWKELLAISDQHHVTPILYQHISANKKQYNFPESVLEQMNQAYLSNVVRNTLLLHETESIMRWLSQANIKAVGLKGLFLIEHVYPDFGMRTMSDIDILLKKADIPRSLLILGELGYRPSTYFDINDENIDIKHVPPFIKGDTSYVEIHWTLLEENEPFSIDTAGIWERAIPAKIAGVEAMSLSIEDLILHLCIHLTYQHNLQIGFRGLYDIALVIMKFGHEINWPVLAERAKEWGAQKVVALTFQLIEQYFDLLIPEEIDGRLIAEPIPSDAFDQARRQVSLMVQSVNVVTPDLASLPETKGFFAKIRLICSRVFLPKQVIARIYNVNPKSIKIFLYYPVRLWDLWRYYKDSVKKMLREDQAMRDGVVQTQAKSRLRAWLTSDI